MSGPARGAVLFDLDGTLIDSAPDLAGALNRLRQQHAMPALPYERLRPLVGSGARGMVGAGFGVVPGDPRFETLKDAFLAEYERGLLNETAPFPQALAVLEGLRRHGRHWGIVTNKATRFAAPVMQGLSPLADHGVLVCGDTTPHAKPHPAPLLAAAEALGCAAADCVYVGDDLRDVQAGRAAGMVTVAVRWGYLGEGEPVEAWNADFIADSSGALLKWLNLA